MEARMEGVRESRPPTRPCKADWEAPRAREKPACPRSQRPTTSKKSSSSSSSSRPPQASFAVGDRVRSLSVRKASVKLARQIQAGDIGSIVALLDDGRLRVEFDGDPPINVGMLAKDLKKEEDPSSPPKSDGEQIKSGSDGEQAKSSGDDAKVKQKAIKREISPTQEPLQPVCESNDLPSQQPSLYPISEATCESGASPIRKRSTNQDVPGGGVNTTASPNEQNVGSEGRTDSKDHVTLIVASERPMVRKVSRIGSYVRKYLLTIMWFLTVALSLVTLVLQLLRPKETVFLQISSVATAAAALAWGVVHGSPLFRKNGGAGQPLSTSDVAAGRSHSSLGKHGSPRRNETPRSDDKAFERSGDSLENHRKGSKDSVSRNSGVKPQLRQSRSDTSMMSDTSCHHYQRKQLARQQTQQTGNSETSQHSFTLEFDVNPGTADGAVVVAHGQNQLARQTTQNSKTSTMSDDMGSIISGSDRLSACDVLVDGELERTAAELVSVTNTNGRMRVSFRTEALKSQNEWQRQLISQQKRLLNAVSVELVEAQKQLQAKEEARAEQKELLRGFRKIITRELDEVNVDDADKIIFIFEEDKEFRKELADLCSMLEYECRAFESWEAGVEEFTQLLMPEASKVVVGDVHDKDPKKRFKAIIQAARPGNRFGSAVLAAVRAQRKKERLVRLVLLGASILMKLPPNWDAQKAFCALISQPWEFEEVGINLRAAGESEVREKLRSQWSISEYLLRPLSLDALRGVMEAALKQHFAEEYLLLEQIGRGSFGIVYRTKRMKDGVVFALKEISTRRMKKQEKDGIEIEMKLLAEMIWPTVLYLVDQWSNIKDRIQYLLMPLLEGGSVDAWGAVQGGHGHDVSMEVIARWYTQSVHGLTYLHWRGILHRDLKPANLVVSMDGYRLRIGDFGSAGHLPGPGPHPMRKNKCEGYVTTVDYASPETVAEGVYYSSSDMFSLGKTFVEILERPGADSCSVSPTRSESRSRWDDNKSTSGSVTHSVSQRSSSAFSDRFARGGSIDLSADAEAGPTLIDRDVFFAELDECLELNPNERVTAADLMARAYTWESVRLAVHDDFSEPELWEAHFRELAKMIKESAAASDMDVDPDWEVLGADVVVSV